MCGLLKANGGLHDQRRCDVAEVFAAGRAVHVDSVAVRRPRFRFVAVPVQATIALQACSLELVPDEDLPWQPPRVTGATCP
jgi:hypothetical protein